MSQASTDSATITAASPLLPRLAGTTDVFYTYTFYDITGDYYTGYGIADAADGLYVGYTQDAFGGGPAWEAYYGFYEIDQVFTLYGDYGAEGRIFTDGYYDATTGIYTTAVVTGLGTGGLGSERGAVNGDNFGFAGRLEARVLLSPPMPLTAELTLPAGTDDVFYTYVFHDSNGDKYAGYGIADEAEGFYVGYTEDVFEGGPAWVAYYGSYEITQVYDLQADYGAEGIVFTTGYYDASTGIRTNQITTGLATAGLGSEYGFGPNQDEFGFAGRLEAQLGWPGPIAYSGV